MGDGVAGRKISDAGSAFFGWGFSVVRGPVECVLVGAGIGTNVCFSAGGNWGITGSGLVACSTKITSASSEVARGDVGGEHGSVGSPAQAFIICRG